MVVSSVDVWMMGALTAAGLGSALAAAGGYALPRWFAVFVGAAAVVLALRRAAGTHRKPEKSQRVAGRIDLVKQIRRWLGRGD
jgi:uncharacterized membrane protein YfcA